MGGSLDQQSMQSNNIQRPLSPHLTIYRPQLTSVLSIIHRSTGASLVALYSGFFLWNQAKYSFGLSSYLFSRGCFGLGHEGVYFLQWFALAAIAFHAFNGIRHFLWDSGLCLDRDMVYRSGYAVVGLTAILWVCLIFYVNVAVPQLVAW